MVVMGDMADYNVQQGLDNYTYGDEEWDYGGEGGYGPQPKTCRRCKVFGLWWGWKNGRYRLFDSAGNIHVCAAASLNSAARKVFK